MVVRLDGIEVDPDGVRRVDRYEQYSEAFGNDPMCVELNDWHRRSEGTIDPAPEEWLLARQSDEVAGRLSRLQEIALDSIPKWQLV